MGTVIGSISLGFVYGNIALIIDKHYRTKVELQNQMDEIKDKLIKSKVPDRLVKKVWEYMQYTFKKRKLFSQLTSFQEISESLQREISFFLHQLTLLNVPLFSYLEPVEVLSIVQKLKSTVYMPGDQIIREGEIGREMFLIVEGSAKVVGKKASGQKYEFFLKKGEYFGEVALISNSRRTANVNAVDFCLLETLHKNDYNGLQVDFPGIKGRLKQGLNTYMAKRAMTIHSHIRSHSLFVNFKQKHVSSSNLSLRIIVMSRLTLFSRILSTRCSSMPTASFSSPKK